MRVVWEWCRRLGVMLVVRGRSSLQRDAGKSKGEVVMRSGAKRVGVLGSRGMIAGVIVAAVAGGLGGCHRQGGPGFSTNTFTYISTEWRPYTISVVDTASGETVWSVDVPVGKQLAMGFRKGNGPNSYRPDMLDWGLEEAGRWFGTRGNQVPVPGPDARRVEVTLRAVPERPVVAPQRKRGAQATMPAGEAPRGHDFDY